MARDVGAQELFDDVPGRPVLLFGGLTLLARDLERGRDLSVVPSDDVRERHGSVVLALATTRHHVVSTSGGPLEDVKYPKIVVLWRWGADRVEQVDCVHLKAQSRALAASPGGW